eukprot:2117303-Amphidinium_carterae.1
MATTFLTRTMVILPRRPTLQTSTMVTTSTSKVLMTTTFMTCNIVILHDGLNMDSKVLPLHQGLHNEQLDGCEQRQVECLLQRHALGEQQLRRDDRLVSRDQLATLGSEVANTQQLFCQEATNSTLQAKTINYNLDFLKLN